MSTATLELTSKEALALWGSLRQHFINAAAVIAEIIERRAWEPLGYGSFAEAWTAEMREITLAPEIRPHVVYQMLAEGTPTEDVPDLVKGIGPRGAAALDRQRRNGVPADYAVVNEHLRRKPCAPDTVHVKVGKAMFAEYKRVADEAGLSVEEIAKDAIAERFSALVSSKAKRSKAS